MSNNILIKKSEQKDRGADTSYKWGNEVVSGADERVGAFGNWTVSLRKLACSGVFFEWEPVDTGRNCAHSPRLLTVIGSLFDVSTRHHCPG